MCVCVCVFVCFCFVCFCFVCVCVCVCVCVYDFFFFFKKNAHEFPMITHTQTVVCGLAIDGEEMRGEIDDLTGAMPADFDVRACTH